MGKLKSQMAKNTVSEQTQQDAMDVAKATQKPGQTKEQTKLIAKGIEKGIAEYKKRQKDKARQLDKKRKKLDAKQEELLGVESEQESETTQKPQRIRQASETSTGSAYVTFAYVALALSLSWSAFHMITQH